MTIKKVKFDCYNDGELIVGIEEEIEVHNSFCSVNWYFENNSFFLRKSLLEDKIYDKIVFRYDNKIYEFKRKLDDDQRHEEGR